MPPPRYQQVGAAHQEWLRIGATLWLARQLRFGLQLPWKHPPRYQRTPSYKLEPKHA